MNLLKLASLKCKLFTLGGQYLQLQNAINQLYSDRNSKTVKPSACPFLSSLASAKRKLTG